MPHYLFRCFEEGCGEGESVWTSSFSKMTPPSCGKHEVEMERDYHAEHGGHVASSTFPFLHPHISGDGKPILITSESHYKEVCKEHSIRRSREASLKRFGDERAVDPNMIVPRPDKAFISDRVEEDPRTMNVNYVEGSGMGVPGSWVGIPSLLTESQEEIEKFFKRNSSSAK